MLQSQEKLRHAPVLAPDSPAHRLVTQHPDKPRLPAWTLNSRPVEGKCGLHSASNSPEQNRSQGRLVVRSPEQLRLHPALVRLNLISSAVELNDACRLRGQPLREPILITTNGTILSGFKD